MCGQLAMALDHTGTTAGDGKIAASRTAAGNCASRDNLSQTRKQEKAQPHWPGFYFLQTALKVSGGGSRGKLRDHAFQRLEGLLGEIGIQSRDLLRLGHERLVGGLREL